MESNHDYDLVFCLPDCERSVEVFDHIRRKAALARLTRGYFVLQVLEGWVRGQEEVARNLAVEKESRQVNLYLCEKCGVPHAEGTEGQICDNALPPDFGVCGGVIGVVKSGEQARPLDVAIDDERVKLAEKAGAFMQELRDGELSMWLEVEPGQKLNCCLVAAEVWSAVMGMDSRRLVVVALAEFLHRLGYMTAGGGLTEWAGEAAEAHGISTENL